MHGELTDYVLLLLILGYISQGGRRESLPRSISSSVGACSGAFCLSLSICIWFTFKYEIVWEINDLLGIDSFFKLTPKGLLLLLFSPLPCCVKMSSIKDNNILLESPCPDSTWPPKLHWPIAFIASRRMI